LSRSVGRRVKLMYPRLQKVKLLYPRLTFDVCVYDYVVPDLDFWLEGVVVRRYAEVIKGGANQKSVRHP
jgi:hypothetical protein